MGSVVTIITARSIAVSSNVSRHVKRLYQCKPVMAVFSSNVSSACNVSSVSKLVQPKLPVNLFVQLL